MPELSPQAQAVFYAFNSKFSWIEDGVPGHQMTAIAAALREAVNQSRYAESVGMTPYGGYCEAQAQIFAIAAELEGQQ